MSNPHGAATGSSAPSPAAARTSPDGERSHSGRLDPFYGQPLPSVEGATSALTRMQKGEAVGASALVAMARANRSLLAVALDAILFRASSQRLSLEDAAAAFTMAESAHPGVMHGIVSRPDFIEVVRHGIHWMGVPSQGVSMEAVDTLLRIGGRVVAQNTSIKAAAADWVQAYCHESYRSKRAAGLAVFLKHQVLSPAE